MKLTYPKSHKMSEIAKLYAEYKSLYPEIIKEWVEIERRSPHIDEDELPPISEHVQKFLDERVENSGHLSLLSAFSDFRQLLNKEYLGRPLIPEGH